MPACYTLSVFKPACPSADCLALSACLVGIADAVVNDQRDQLAQHIWDMGVRFTTDDDFLHI